MSAFSGILSIFQTLFSPIGQVFHYIFFEPVFNILILIYHGVGNFALAIIILTLLIRGALYPLTRRQLASTRKMQQLQPQLKAIQAQHRGDPQAAMAAQQALYKEHGVSMYGGCLPLLIQMPFLYALFYSFEAVLSTSKDALATVNGYIYPFLPKLTALPNPHFLWLNLAQPDPFYILPVLAALLTFIQMRMALPVKRPGAPKDPTTSTTQSMQWIMPLFTLFLGTRFASGLALYWTVSTGFSAVQQYTLSGWGSLFVGVPGMERFVPEPKDLTPVTTPATTGGRGQSNPGGQATQAEPARGMGFLASMRELLQQTREQASANALVAREQAQRARVVEADASSGAVASNGANGAKGAQANRDRRPRPAKSGATLVRPASAGETTAEPAIESAQQLEASASTALPEKRRAHDNAAAMDGIIADAGVHLNGNGANASNGKNGAGKSGSAPKLATAGASGGAPRQGNGQGNGQSTGQGSSQRGNSGGNSGANGQRKHQQSRKGNRPKGGR